MKASWVRGGVVGSVFDCDKGGIGSLAKAVKFNA